MKYIFISCLIVLSIAGSTFAQEKLSLEQSIQIALRQNPQIFRAKADIEAAKGLVGQARGGFFPQLSLEGGFGKYYAKPSTARINMTGTPTNITMGIDEQAYINTGSISLIQPLFAGGKIKTGFSMADKNLRIKEQELRKKKSEVVFETTKAYYEVLKANKIVELSIESREMARRYLKKLSILLKVGSTTRSNVLRAQLRLANANLALNQAEQGLQISQNQFNNLLGRNLNSPLNLKEVKFSEEVFALYPYQDLLTIAYEFRPEWKQYFLSKKIAEDNVLLAYNNLWPNLSLVGRYDASLIKYSSFDNDTASWSGLLYGSWKIFDGTANVNKIKEAKANLESQKAAKTNIKNGIALEVRNAQFKLVNVMQKIKISQKALEIAQENFRLINRSFDLGAATNLEVIDAQVALTQASLNHVEAQYKLQISKANLNKSIGREVY